MLDWLKQLHSEEGLQHLVAAGGMLVVIGIVFAETGLLVGFFLPGDTLLVVAGVMCALDPLHRDQPALFSYPLLVGALIAAAVIGDWVNFWMGKVTGDRIWDRPDGRFFKRRYLEEAHAFYERRGGLALAIARFIPVARTFVPFAAGMSRMPFRSFMGWNVLGAAAWVLGITALGYWFGSKEPLRHNLSHLVLVVMAVSLIPLAAEVVRRLRRKPAADLPGEAGGGGEKR